MTATGRTRLTTSFYDLNVGRLCHDVHYFSAYVAYEWFLCSRCRAVPCDACGPNYVARNGVLLLCPRCRAVLCDGGGSLEDLPRESIRLFLCPRLRAVLCDQGWVGSLWSGQVVMPSVSGGASGVAAIAMWAAAAFTGVLLCPLAPGGLCHRQGLQLGRRVPRVSMP